MKGIETGRVGVLPQPAQRSGLPLMILAIKRPNRRSGPYEKCDCLRCQSKSKRLLAIELPGFHRYKREAGYRQLCSGCGKQLLGQPIAKGGPNAPWQCETCAEEQKRHEREQYVLANLQKETNTAEQEELIRFARWGSGNGIVEAKAGSGKTSTIIRCYSEIKNSLQGGESGTCIFVAFNKSIVEELQRRGMPSRTAHALAWRAWKQNLWASCRSDVQEGEESDLEEEEEKPLMRGKTKRILAELYPGKGGKGTSLAKEMVRFVKKLVSLAKNYGVGLPSCLDNTLETWNWLVNHNSLQRILPKPKGQDSPSKEQVEEGVACARAVLEKSISLGSQPEKPIWDFDDMLYMALLLDLDVGKYDWVYIDESQDLNLVRMLLIERLSHEQTRVIAVGDPCQAIYGFTGAAHESMSRFAKRFKASRFSLTTTWRCPSSHVNLANCLLTLRLSLFFCHKPETTFLRAMPCQVMRSNCMSRKGAQIQQP